MARLRLVALVALGLGALAACLPEQPAPPPGDSDARATPDCVITRVVDGDTVHALCRGSGAERLRLMGYDTPETYRARCSAERRLGDRATRRLRAELARAGDIRMRFYGRDRYQRLLVRLTLDGRDIADTMIAAGLAVRYSGGRRIDWCERLASP